MPYFLDCARNKFITFQFKSFLYPRGRFAQATDISTGFHYYKASSFVTE